jgi:endoglycosylceramidase
MRKQLTKARCALALCATLAGCAIPASAQAGPALPLAHAGRWITDAHGRVVVLHGTNMVYKLAPYYPAAAGFDAKDAAFLRSIGLNAVRVGVIWKALEPQPGVYDDAYLEQIEQTVALLAKRGIVSLLDFHQDMYNEKYQGEGFPDWAVQDDGLPNEPKAGFPNNYFVNPALQRAFDNFWANKPGPGGIGLQDRYAAAWAHVAQRFAANRNVLGYEILNEPFMGSEWQTCANTEGCPLFDQKLDAFNHKVNEAIRAIDQRTLVWYEPNPAFNFGANTHVTSLGPRSGFAFHDYCLANEAEGCPTQEITMTNADKYVAGSGDALLLDEWGATSGPTDLHKMVALADQHMVPWMEWAFCLCGDPTTAGQDQGMIQEASKPPSGENLNASTVEALVEPYPQLISGTPLSWGFNRESATFSFRYSTQSADGSRSFRAGSVTQIATPKLSYPSGYGVQVSGGKAVSKPGARLLNIRSCPGANEVAVTVAPGNAPSQGC